MTILLAVGGGFLSVAGIGAVMDSSDFSQALHHQGKPGTLVVTGRSCGKAGCDLSGTFTSDDGTVHENNGISFTDAEIGEHLPVQRIDGGLLFSADYKRADLVFDLAFATAVGAGGLLLLLYSVAVLLVWNRAHQGHPWQRVPVLPKRAA